LSCRSPSLFTSINNSCNEPDNPDNAIYFRQLRDDVVGL
jgi:hypothetical protein